MRLNNIYNKLALTSPYVEVMLRHLYWRNVDWLKKYSPHKATRVNEIDITEKVDFETIIEWLKAKGVGAGDLLIVHSGYGELERTGLSPEEVVERLLQLVGPTGTLAMPVIRRFKDMEKAQKEGKNLAKETFKYNVRKTLVISGMLPYALMNKEGAVVSHHPFNPLCAVGPLANEMMEHNLDGNNPSPHGPNSCWKYCYDHGAKICSIGTDIEHHNTIIHIAEEAFGYWRWPSDKWYEQLRFEIIDESNKSQTYVVSNRKEEWGKLRFAEINVCTEEIKRGIMISEKVGDITVGYVDPSLMVDFLQEKNKNGYPYFVLPFEKV